MMFGDMEIRLLDDGTFKVDGGAMFGIVPKVLWEKIAPADEANRVSLRTGVLLVRHQGKNILVDTGNGTKLGPKLRSIHGLGPSLLAGALGEAGLAPDDIDIVVLTHLHIDHVGGATRLDESGEVVPAFPRAEHVIQAAEWEAAVSPNERTRGGYVPNDFVPLREAGLVKLVDGDCDLVDGVRLVRTGGHSDGHQIVVLDSGQRKAAFLGDLIPTVSHLKLPYMMAYDLYPIDLLAHKKDVIEAALAENWLLIWQHDPNVEMGHLRREGHDVLVEAE
jgi:glyoxylase-like metal-dependent hydrolase (beta-lactamase superfamily II)